MVSKTLFILFLLHMCGLFNYYPWLDKVCMLLRSATRRGPRGIMSGQIWEGILSGGDFVRGDSVQGDYVRIPTSDGQTDGRPAYRYNVRQSSDAR